MFLICSFPPPLNGQSLVNRMLASRFSDDGLDVHVFDISPSTYHGLRYHITRIHRVIIASATLLRRGRDVIYLSSEAQFGAIYLIFLVMVARIRADQLFLHHHVYSYINNRSMLHAILMRLTGSKCTHILLSPRMARDFRARFGEGPNHLTLHNSLFVDATLRRCTPREARGGIKLGFIGRLEEAKGFGDYLDLATLLVDHPEVGFVVAGDHEHSEYRERIRDLQRRLGHRLQLCGFVVGDQKRAFFEEIDLLVFPSRYANEASPMVCFEALAMEVPVLTTRVGAVADIVDESCGVVFERTDDLAARMAAAVAHLLACPRVRGEWQSAAAARFADLHRTATREYDELRSRLQQTETPSTATKPRVGGTDRGGKQR